MFLNRNLTLRISGMDGRSSRKVTVSMGAFSSFAHHLINFTGTYTYPISFEIPANAPATLRCPYGTVDWHLYATVHRPGRFTPKLTATREVMVIPCPKDEENEDTGNIVIERPWEQQLQYSISISGHSFCIGGTIPITISFLPLSKVKIRRFSVHVEGMSHSFQAYMLSEISIGQSESIIIPKCDRLLSRNP